VAGEAMMPLAMEARTIPIVSFIVVMLDVVYEFARVGFKVVELLELMVIEWMMRKTRY